MELAFNIGLFLLLAGLLLLADIRSERRAKEWWKEEQEECEKRKRICPCPYKRRSVL